MTFDQHETLAFWQGTESPFDGVHHQTVMHIVENVLA